MTLRFKTEEEYEKWRRTRRRVGGFSAEQQLINKWKYDGVKSKAAWTSYVGYDLVTPPEIGQKSSKGSAGCVTWDISDIPVGIDEITKCRIAFNPSSRGGDQTATDIWYGLQHGAIAQATVTDYTYNPLPSPLPGNELIMGDDVFGEWSVGNWSYQYDHWWRFNHWATVYPQVPTTYTMRIDYDIFGPGVPGTTDSWWILPEDGFKLFLEWD